MELSYMGRPSSPWAPSVSPALRSRHTVGTSCFAGCWVATLRFSRLNSKRFAAAQPCHPGFAGEILSKSHLELNAIVNNPTGGRIVDPFSRDCLQIKTLYGALL